MVINVVELLAGAGRNAPSADNSQPWLLEWDGSCLNVRFRGELSAALSPSPTNPATLLAIGAVVENIVQMGTALGLELQPEIGPVSTLEAPTYARIPIEIEVREQSPCPDHPLFNRHTNRFAYESRPLPSATLSELPAMSQGSARVQVLDQRGDIRQVADLIKASAKVRFRVREAHEWLAGSLRFGNTADDETGMDIHSLDLPPGGGLLMRLIRSWKVMSALNRIGAYKFMAATDTAPVYRAPTLVVIKAPGDASGAIDAGRLMARAWIRLNEQNIAVHPYYAITDQLQRLRDNSLPTELRNEVLQVQEACAGSFALQEGESVYMVLRTGYPRKSAPRSKRVPLQKVFRNAAE